MLQRLQSSSSAHAYKPLASENVTQSAVSPGARLSSHGLYGECAAPMSRSGSLAAAKSHGDLRNLFGRTRGKKTRAIKWLVLKASGERQVFTLDKRQLIQTCQLEIPIRDMRLMDSALGTETLSQLLVRDNALVFSMEHVRLIIMHDKVVVPLDDNSALPQPPPTPTQQTTGDRPPQPPNATANELKERFIAHLEGVVMDWALQHGGANGYGCGNGNGNGGGSSLSPFYSLSGAVGSTYGSSNHGIGGGAAAPSSSTAKAAVMLPPVTPAPQISGTGGGSAGGAGGLPQSPSIAAQLEAHLVKASQSARPSGGSGGVPGILNALAGNAASGGAGGGGGGSETASLTAFDPEYQPFEMLVLETALSEICTLLSRECETLHMQCQPALEALMKNADTVNLEAVRRVKTQHSRLVTRVTATREALERLMEDDDDMVRMCLTQQAHMRVAAVAAAAAAVQQQQQQQLSQPGATTTTITATPHSLHQGLSSFVTAAAAAAAAAAAVTHSPNADPHTLTSAATAAAGNPELALLMGAGSLPASYMRPASLAARAVRHQVGKKSGGLGEALAEAAAAAAVGGVNTATAAGSTVAGGGGGGMGSSASGSLGGEPVEHDFLDVEALLESYAIIVDTTYQTLMSMGEYIDDTEDLINIQLDFARNKLIRFDILLTTGTFALAFFNIVTGMLGENLALPEAITQTLAEFIVVNGATAAFCLTTFLTLFCIFKWQRVV